MTTLTADARLDNPVYAALPTAHSRFAQSCGNALRYPADVAPFLGLPLEPSRQDWRGAIEVVPPGTYAAIVHAGVDVPEQWKTLQEFERESGESACLAGRVKIRKSVLANGLTERSTNSSNAGWTFQVRKKESVRRK